MFFKNIIFITVFFICLITAGAQENRQIEAENLFAAAEPMRRAKDVETRLKAIEKYEKAREIFNELGLRKREADSLNNIGYIYKNLGEFEKSLFFLEKALRINREINNSNGLFSTLLNMGQSFRYLNRQKEAAVQVNEALAISRKAGDREQEAAALNELGVLYYTNGEIQKCLEPFELAAAIFKELDKKIPRGSLHNNIGLINRMLGNQENAIEHYTKALKIFRETKHLDGEADVILNLSAAYSDLFRTVEAMEHFNLALSIFRRSGNRQREAVILNNIGVFYNNLGDYARAGDYYMQSGNIAEEIGNRRQYASAVKNLGILQLNLNDPDKALEYLNLALELSREVKNRLDEGWILNNIGLAYEKKGEHEKARQFMLEALEILRELGNRHGIARALFNLGSVLQQINEKDRAMESYAEALQIRRRLLTPGEQAKILLEMARIERDAGNLSAAQDNIEQAVEKIESLRTGIPGQDLRTAFFSIGRNAYDFNIDLLMRMNSETASPGNLAKAFEISERSRARSLLESLFESRTEIRQGVEAQLLVRERRLQNRLNARERYRMKLISGKPQPEKLEIVEKEIRALLGEYQQIRDEIKVKSPQYSALTQPQPLSLKEIQQNVLDGETVLLEYSLGEENSYLWIISKEAAESRKLPKRKEIATAARRFYKLLNARNDFPDEESPDQRQLRLDAADKQLPEAARKLGKMIIPLSAAELSGKRLLIVAEDILQYIPFGALKIAGLSKKRPANKNDRFLIETNEIVYLPSASILAVLRSSKENNKSSPENLIAVLADPVFSPDDARVRAPAIKPNKEKSRGESLNPQIAQIKSRLRSDFSRLRFSRREAEAISNLVPDEQKFVALDFAANRQSINSEKFNRSRIVHFATHGIITSEFPELSGIVLSLVDENGELQDGFLRLHDIYNLHLESELVVLSACDTALGKEIKGEGIVGLTRGFMYAGAAAVAASLWKVDDRSTAHLMERFYLYLLKENLRPAAALRKAQISMLKEKSTQHPYHWGAFILQGDWK